MQVILLQAVKNVGKADDVVEVATGYARNFLLPKKLAVEATPTLIQQLKNKKIKLAREYDIKKANAQKLSKELLTIAEFTLVLPVGNNDKLFGAVTNKDIAQLLRTYGFNIDKKNIYCDETIKTVGKHTFIVKLFENISVTLTLNIIKQ